MQVKWLAKALLNLDRAVDQIRTISKQRLKQRIDQLPSDKAAQLRKLITDMYGE